METESFINKKVAFIDGPGQFPKEGLCSKLGTVKELLDTRWGNEYRIICQDGSEEFTSRIELVPSSKIGVYLLVPTDQETVL